MVRFHGISHLQFVKKSHLRPRASDFRVRKAWVFPEARGPRSNSLLENPAPCFGSLSMSGAPLNLYLLPVRSLWVVEADKLRLPCEEDGVTRKSGSRGGTA